MAIQWNHAKCCGADPCCHDNEICARRVDPVAYRLVKLGDISRQQCGFSLRSTAPARNVRLWHCVFRSRDIRDQLAKSPKFWLMGPQIFFGEGGTGSTNFWPNFKKNLGGRRTWTWQRQSLV